VRRKWRPAALIAASTASFAFWWTASGGKIRLPVIIGPAASEAGAPTDLFPCPTPYHHDGDAIRCGHHGKSMRLYAIDAPKMPGACRPGRIRTPGDPFASREHLASLTMGKAVSCRQIDTDRYRRRIVRCFSGKIDLSCAMVRDGFAVERYGRLHP